MGLAAGGREVGPQGGEIQTEADAVRGQRPVRVLGADQPAHAGGGQRVVGGRAGEQLGGQRAVGAEHLLDGEERLHLGGQALDSRATAGALLGPSAGAGLAHAARPTGRGEAR